MFNTLNYENAKSKVDFVATKKKKNFYDHKN